MATFTVNITFTAVLDIEIPDSKVKNCLENELSIITDRVALSFDGMPVAVDVQVSETDITLDDYSYITKDDGNDYEWDDYECKLIKL